MKIVYPLEVVSGHLIARIGRTRTFLDTGAPISIGRGPLQVLGHDVALRPSGFGVTPKYLSDQVGTRVDALLGTDVLALYPFDVDYAGATCTFHRAAPPMDGVRIPATDFLKTPIVEATVAGRPVRLIVDTGAQFGYLAASLVEGRRPLETRADFHPTLGDFTTEVHQVTIELGGLPVSLPFGVMPPTLEAMLAPIDTQGVIGTDLFRQFRTLFNLPGGELILAAA